jgi:hypothetical protein
MLIKFWTNDTDAFAFAANHIVAIQVMSYLNGACDRVQDVEVHANGAKFRFPHTGRNISATLCWEAWCEQGESNGTDRI